jgi:hypothetical protein
LLGEAQNRAAENGGFFFPSGFKATAQMDETTPP